MRPGSGASLSASWTSWISRPKGPPDDQPPPTGEGGHAPPAGGAAMRGASRASFIKAREQLTAALADRADPAVLGEELFAVTHLLDHEREVRRALTDATSPTAARSGLARRLLDGRVSPPTLDLVTGMVDSRWSSPRDLADAAEQLAVMAT